MIESKTTTDPKKIGAWGKAEGRRPASVAGTDHGDEAGVQRIDLSEGDGDLEPLPSDEFFAEVEESRLASPYREAAGGDEQRFFTLGNR